MEVEMYVYIVKLVARDGIAIRSVCGSPERALQMSLGKGHKYLLTSKSKGEVADRSALIKQLRGGREFYLASTPSWSGELVHVSRYRVV
jgi:hypothetical protein